MRTDENVDESTDSLMRERIIDIKIGCLIRKTQIIAKDCLLILVKSRLALGSPGCSVGWLFVTMPKTAQYTGETLFHTRKEE